MTLWSNLWLTLGNFQSNFWLHVPMPIKLFRYTLSILCNVSDTVSDNFSHTTQHNGCGANTIGFRCTTTESKKYSEFSIRTLHLIIYGFSCIIQLFHLFLCHASFRVIQHIVCRVLYECWHYFYKYNFYYWQCAHLVPRATALVKYYVYVMSRWMRGELIKSLLTVGWHGEVGLKFNVMDF